MIGYDTMAQIEDFPLEDTGLADSERLAPIDMLALEEEIESKRISTQKTRDLAERYGIDNANAFARVTGLSYPTAAAWWNDDGMARVDAKVLIRLVMIFGVGIEDLISITSL